MSKTYKVSYKTYLNERLKEVSLHGKTTYPLYVQVTFDRKTIFFKSYFFELFSKTRYMIVAAGMMGGPTIAQIIEEEEKLLDFVAEKTLEDFSLETFKREYDYYCRDLCDVTEPAFADYLHRFFSDKGMPALATTIREGSRLRIMFDVVRDMKRAFDKAFYAELIENSFFNAPPYLQLYGFVQKTKKWPLLSITVMEWDDSEIRQQFAEYVEVNYPGIDVKEILERINKSLRSIGSEPTA